MKKEKEQFAADKMPKKSSLPRKVTLLITETDGDGKIIQGRSTSGTYKYGNTVDNLVCALIKGYDSTCNLALEDVQVRTICGRLMHSGDLILDSDVGYSDPMLKVQVIIRNLKPQVAAPNSVIEESKNKKVSLIVTECYSDASEHQCSDYQYPYTYTSTVGDVKAYIIQQYKDKPNYAVKPEDIIVQSVGMKLLGRDSAHICYEVDSSEPNLLVRVTVKVPATERGRDDKSIDGVVQIASDVQEIFATELGFKNDDMQRLLPLLASTGIHSMSGLVGASCEQIAALKLKVIPARKLHKLLEARRGEGSTPAVPSVRPSTSGEGRAPAVPSARPSTSGGGSTPAVPSARPNIRNIVAKCQNIIEVASHENVCDNDEALVAQFDLETKGAINTAFDIIAQASVDELIALKKLVDRTDTIRRLDELKKLVDCNDTMKQLDELINSDERNKYRKNAGRSDRCADMYTGHNSYHSGKNAGKLRSTKYNRLLPALPDIKNLF